MSVIYKCRLCKRGSLSLMREKKIRIYREVPEVLEQGDCYVTDHLCTRCALFYDSYVSQAEFEAAQILLQPEDPLAKAVDEHKEMPTNCDNAWDFLVSYDRLSNEALAACKVLWRENPDRMMTIGEIVAYLMQKEKEAAANADEPSEEIEKTEV